jgi:glutathione S-transferase
MKLIGRLPSPFVRKACVVLIEKALAFDIDADGPSQPNNRITEYSPLGKIPILMTEAGEMLFDSRVIVEYVDMLSPGRPLLPPPGPDRIAVKKWEALADGICDAAVAIVAEGRRPENERSPAWIDKQRAKIERSVPVLAGELGERKLLHGDELTLADLAAGVALSYVDYRLPEIDWRPQFPGLVAHVAQLTARPSFARTANSPNRISPDPR